MDGFLTQVARDLYGRYGERVSTLSAVFPSRRASLFFGEALAGIISRPLWQPESLTIDSIAEELSGIMAGGNLRLVTELYRVYVEFHPSESFDAFYSWGELLLGDFDSIDKYLIDADVLFSNLIDLHELDDRFDYLSPDERAVIEKFWGTFSLASPEQKDFLRVWRTLGPVYHKFRARLRELGIAYQGMVYREAAERISEGRALQIQERHYVVVGLNALSRSEQVIFEYLRQIFEVDFYWDYDNYYTGDTPFARAQEAGRFMRDNLCRFPPVAPLAGGVKNFTKPKKIRSVAAASDVLQCKYAGLRLAEIARRQGTAPGRETAVVLCDEGLLTPLLWSMPPEVEEMNITMGYPLRLHPAYIFVERLLELQNRRRVGRASLAFHHSDVEGLLRHPYLATVWAGGKADDGGSGEAGDSNRASRETFTRSQYVYISAARLRTTPIFEKIFTAPEGWRALSDWLVDILGEVGKNIDTRFFSIIIDHIRTLTGSLEGCELELSVKTYASLLRRSLQSVTVPFEGEPLEGVQIMGILETRALDFENIIFLSSGDDNLPGNLMGAPSFIPYSLKMAFGLPTPEHHEGVYAYHFFRLIGRARQVDMVWSSTADDRSAGEPSRYVLQLDYESPHTIEKDSITVDVNLSPREPIVVEKSNRVMETLNEFLRTDDTRRRLSPSMFYTYVECPLKFYFRAVARLRFDDEVSEEVDNALFGNILHLAMQRLYTPLTGVSNPQQKIRALIGSAEVEKAVSEAAHELYTREEGSVPEDRSGSIMLACNTIVDYINRSILPFDAGRQESYTIELLEEWVEREISLGDEESKSGAELEPESESQTRSGLGSDYGSGGKIVCFRGKVDRIDRLGDGTLQVIDYKTGNSKNNSPALLQTRLYAMMLGRDKNIKVQPVLYYVRDMSRPDYTPPSTEPEADFEENLRTTLGKLFDPTVPFTQCPDPKPCGWCDFNTICRR